MQIRLDRVSRRFGESWAVRDLDLTVASGEFISLVGGSGCGKTTTLRMIAGFDEPTSGEIWLGDRKVNGVPVQDRGVGLVFQSYALFPTMTVAGNVAFGLEVGGAPPERVRARVQEMLSLTHLSALADRYPWQLSGGQQQRVALARALAVAPRVLLLDEPLSALDARIRLSLRAEIRRIQQELKLTALYVTHDQEEALAIADRIVVMDKGRAAQVGTARQIYDHPESAFVADFVGISNTLPAVWRGEGVVEIGRHRVRVAGRGAEGAPVKVCVRPERLRPKWGEAEQPGLLLGTVGVRTFLGSLWRVQFVIGDDILVLVDVPREQEAQLMSLSRGAPVALGFDPEDARLFDGNS